MLVSYRISQEDYVNAMRLHDRLMPRPALIVVAIVAGMAIVATYGPVWLQPASVGALCGLLVVMLFNWGASPLIARRRYRLYKAIHEEFGILLRDHDFLLWTSRTEVTVSWAKVRGWRENSDYVLVYVMPRLFYIVPKSLRKKGFDIETLTRRLREHVGAPA